MDREGDGAAQSAAQGHPPALPSQSGLVGWHQKDKRGINRGLSLLLTCQCDSDQPVRLLEPLGPHNTWSPKPCLTHSGPAWAPLWLQAIFSQWVPLCSLPPCLSGDWLLLSLPPSHWEVQASPWTQEPHHSPGTPLEPSCHPWHSPRPH